MSCCFAKRHSSRQAIVPTNTHTQPTLPFLFIQFTVPNDLYEVLLPHIVVGHAKVSRSTVETLFVSAHGAEFHPAGYSVYYKELINKQCHDRNVHICPQRVRHIFVEWVRRMEDNVDEEAAAMVMGNSVKTWNAVYHLTYVESRAQEGVNRMKDLRSELEEIIETQGQQEEEEEEEQVEGEGPAAAAVAPVVIYLTQ